MPGTVAIEDRAEFLAGWAAGQAAASACGPLPDEIARDVVLSEKTVSSHVPHLLRRTGAANRVDLARLATHGQRDVSG